MTNKLVTDAKEGVEHEVAKGLELLYRLRDEARVRVHLAGMDAQQAWSNLEPHIEQAETMAKNASASTLETLKSLTTKLESVIASIGKPS